VTTTCTIKSHRLIHPSLPKPAPLAARPAVAAGGIQWPSFTGTATLVGTSSDGRTTVYVDASLGAPAMANAKALLADATRINALDVGFFGTSGKANVILFALGGQTDGTGGADHASCSYSTGGNIEVCVAYGQDARCSALYEAELSECDMGSNLCGLSTGEALSRLCAEYGIFPSGPNPLSDFTSTQNWVQAGYPNWIDKIQPSDGDYPSIGCGMCFLSWLRSQKYTVAQIAQTMVALGDAGTLAQLWQKLTGQSGSPWTTFLAAAEALPAITTDDPFAGVTPPPPPPPPPGKTGTLAVTTALPKGTIPVNGAAASLTMPTGLDVGSYQVGGTTTPPPPPPPPPSSALFSFTLSRAKPAGIPLVVRGKVPAMPAGKYSISHAAAAFETLLPDSLTVPDLSPWWDYLEAVLAKYGEQAVEQVLKDILAGKIPMPGKP
jgi:hypothetical protein